MLDRLDETTLPVPKISLTAPTWLMGELVFGLQARQDNVVNP